MDEYDYIINEKRKHHAGWYAVHQQKKLLRIMKGKIIVTIVFIGMVTAMDEAIGKVVAAFKDKGLWENTVMLFTTGMNHSC